MTQGHAGPLPQQDEAGLVCGMCGIAKHGIPKRDLPLEGYLACSLTDHQPSVLTPSKRHVYCCGRSVGASSRRWQAQWMSSAASR
jgi:hypothetical protein